jgi:formiminoglutamate deiminase
VPVTRFFADYAWLGEDTATAGVLLGVDGERIVELASGVDRPVDAVHLRGVTLPGLANGHSHAFHRALRGRTHRAGGTFWTWREDMYAVAAVLTPDSYYDLARATYAEMALAGITCVGEFHYLHHGPDGAPYAEVNALGEALIAAARDAGIRITLLDTCYLAGGFDQQLQGPQLRFGDGDAAAWAHRVSALQGTEHARIGAAIHSVRAVPADQLKTVAAWAQDRRAPLHVHLSEQRAENEACRAAHGRTPTQLLADEDVLGPGTTAVHATHLTGGDIDLLGRSGTTICMCPTTGAGPRRRHRAGSSPGRRRLAGCRSAATATRSSTSSRRHAAWSSTSAWPPSVAATGRPPALLRAATCDGHASLGWSDAGA